jgi:hypothetical protein
MTLSFANVAAGGQSVQIAFKSNTAFGIHGVVTWEGRVVGKIDKDDWKLRHGHNITSHLGWTHS